MRKLKLHIKDKDYTLMMTRDTIKTLEAVGFVIEDFERKPVTYYDMLWASLFLANHKDVNGNLAVKLREEYEKEHNSALVIKFAIEEYKSFMNALADIDSKENEESLEIIED